MPHHSPAGESTDDAVIDFLDERDPAADQHWHDILTGDISLAAGSRIGRAFFRHMPS